MFMGRSKEPSEVSQTDSFGAGVWRTGPWDSSALSRYQRNDGVPQGRYLKVE